MNPDGYCLVNTAHRTLQNVAITAPGEAPRGRVVRRDLHGGRGAGYLLYVPRIGAVNTRCFVAIHGLSRNCREHAETFAPFCEREGVVLLVPNFDDERFGDYQRLGRHGRGPRSDMFLNLCLDEVALQTGADVSRIYLFGHSAGAQFAHRYLMVHPHRVAHAAFASAGWYTFPDNRVRYPRGIRSTRRLPGVIFQPADFLQVPVAVMVGERDVGATALRRSARIDEQQGTTRVERAHRWTSAMQAAARAHGLAAKVSCIDVPGIDHSFARFSRRGELAARVFVEMFHSPVGHANGAHAPACASACPLDEPV